MRLIYLSIHIFGVWLLSWCLHHNHAYGQREKVEVERFISKKAVPDDAKEWLRDAFENRIKRLRWYEETGQGARFFEAKFLYQKRNYSVKFNESGNLVDVEFIILLEEIPENARHNIIAYLETTFSKYKIERIQEQWTGKSDDVEDAVDEGDFKDIIVRYELEYYDRSGQPVLFEGLFDSTGHLLQERTVKMSTTLNFDY